MIIIGLDLSIVETGYCIYDIETEKMIECDVIKSDKKNFKDPDELDRLEFIVNKIKEVICHHGVKEAVIEGFSFGSRGQALFQLAGLSYMVRYWLKSNNIKYTLIPPTMLKKWVTKKGTAAKDIMILCTYKRWKKTFDNNNKCDSFCLCKYYEKNK